MSGLGIQRSHGAVAAVAEHHGRQRSEKVAPHDHPLGPIVPRVHDDFDEVVITEVPEVEGEGTKAAQDGEGRAHEHDVDDDDRARKVIGGKI